MFVKFFSIFLFSTMKTNPETTKMDLPIQQKPGYLKFCEVRIFRVDGL